MILRVLVLSIRTLSLPVLLVLFSSLLPSALLVLVLVLVSRSRLAFSQERSQLIASG